MNEEFTIKHDGGEAVNYVIEQPDNKKMLELFKIAAKGIKSSATNISVTDSVVALTMISDDIMQFFFEECLQYVFVKYADQGKEAKLSYNQAVNNLPFGKLVSLDYIEVIIKVLEVFVNPFLHSLVSKSQKSTQEKKARSDTNP